MKTELDSDALGQIVILNGVPKSGKSSIVKVIQETFEGVWMNLGVDVFCRSVTPEEYQPGIGLRPGGERPDLEQFIVASYIAMYESIAAHSRQGFNAVVDVGHHDGYSQSLGILSLCAKCLEELPVLFVGVHCPLNEIMKRRQKGSGKYLVGNVDEPYPLPVKRWQELVHAGVSYDLELDTSLLDPGKCADVIRERLDSGKPGFSFHRISNA